MDFLRNPYSYSEDGSTWNLVCELKNNAANAANVADNPLIELDRFDNFKWLKFFIHNELVINDDLWSRRRGCTQISLLSQINLEVGWMCHDMLWTIPIYF